MAAAWKTQEWEDVYTNIGKIVDGVNDDAGN
jgi:hypothetical protein